MLVFTKNDINMKMEEGTYLKANWRKFIATTTIDTLQKKKKALLVCFLL